jgi:hypothetical protein
MNTYILHHEIAAAKLPMASSKAIFTTGRDTRPIGAKAEAPTMEATIAMNLNIFLVLNCEMAATTKDTREEKTRYRYPFSNKTHFYFGRFTGSAGLFFLYLAGIGQK